MDRIALLAALFPPVLVLSREVSASVRIELADEASAGDLIPMPWSGGGQGAPSSVWRTNGICRFAFADRLEPSRLKIWALSETLPRTGPERNLSSASSSDMRVQVPSPLS